MSIEPSTQCGLRSFRIGLAELCEIGDELEEEFHRLTEFRQKFNIVGHGYPHEVKRVGNLVSSFVLKRRAEVIALGEMGKEDDTTVRHGKACADCLGDCAAPWKRREKERLDFRIDKAHKGESERESYLWFLALASSSKSSSKVAS